MRGTYPTFIISTLGIDFLLLPTSSRQAIRQRAQPGSAFQNHAPISASAVKGFEALQTFQPFIEKFDVRRTICRRPSCRAN